MPPLSPEESRQKKTRGAHRGKGEKGGGGGKEEEEHEEEEEEEAEEETRALDYTEKGRTERIVLFQTAAGTTCTRRGGPFLALTWPYVAPSSLRLSDLTWSFFRSGFSPRRGPNPPFLSACARKWLRRPNMAAPFRLSLRRKRGRIRPLPFIPSPLPAKRFAVSNARPFLAFSNASFVRFDSSNQECILRRPYSTIRTRQFEVPLTCAMLFSSDLRKFTFRLSLSGMEKEKIARSLEEIVFESGPLEISVRTRHPASMLKKMVTFLENGFWSTYIA